MIYFYSGTPGSGKSLDVAKQIVFTLKTRKRNVISNIPINLQNVRGRFNKKAKLGNFTYLSNQDITPQFFYDYAKEHHSKGKEGQTLIVFDEAQMLFSPTVIKIRQADDKMFRAKWLSFFTQHRHLGYDIIISSQFDKLIDPQIRCLFEYNYIHRKVNNFKIGWLLNLLHFSVFCKVCYWYGVKERINSEFYVYSKRYSKIYDSYDLEFSK